MGGTGVADSESFQFVDMQITDNLFRNIGEGFGMTRHILDTGNAYRNIEALGSAIHFNRLNYAPDASDCFVTGNKMWGASQQFIFGVNFSTAGKGIQFYDNTVFAEYGSGFGALPRDPKDVVGAWDFTVYPYEEETLEALIDQKLIGDNEFLYY